MMRKLLLMICTVLLLAMTPQLASAADALFRMLHADEVESFKADQDAIIVGQLIDKQGDLFQVKVLQVISGSVKGDVIGLKEFEFSFTDAAKPQVQDYCVASIKKTRGHYKKAWGIFQASSGDYQTLKLLTTTVKSDAAAIEWYVNSGGNEKDFFFKENSAFVRRPNGESIQIYPKQGTTVPTPIVREVTENKASSYPKSGVLLFLALGTILFIWIKRRRL